MRKLRKLLVPALITLPLALAACGGSSDEDEIKDIIKAGGDNPVTVCDNATEALLEQLGGKEECVKAAKEEPKDPAEVKSVTVDGEKATAKITDSDGAQTIKFVKEDGDWKVAG